MAATIITLQMRDGCWVGYADADPPTGFKAIMTMTAGNAYTDADPTTPVPFTITTHDGFYAGEKHLTIDS